MNKICEGLRRGLSKSPGIPPLHAASLPFTGALLLFFFLASGGDALE